MHVDVDSWYVAPRRWKFGGPKMNCLSMGPENKPKQIMEGKGHPEIIA